MAAARHWETVRSAVLRLVLRALARPGERVAKVESTARRGEEGHSLCGCCLACEDVLSARSSLFVSLSRKSRVECLLFANKTTCLA